MARPELIVMLTWNDKTVGECQGAFLESKDAPAKFWGCKREGILRSDFLGPYYHDVERRKETFLETVAIDEEHCLIRPESLRSAGGPPAGHGILRQRAKRSATRPA